MERVKGETSIVTKVLIGSILGALIGVGYTFVSRTFYNNLSQFEERVAISEAGNPTASQRFMAWSDTVSKLELNQHFLLRVRTSFTGLDELQELVRRGADVNFMDNEGNTALMLASGRSRRDIVEFLLNNGADVSLRDQSGRTALDYARGFEMRALLEKATVANPLARAGVLSTFGYVTNPLSAGGILSAGKPRAPIQPAKPDPTKAKITTRK